MENSIKIVNFLFLKAFYWREDSYWGVWFRLFGWGLNFSNTPLMFSQRNGLGAGVLRVGQVKITCLKPWKADI